MMRFETVGNDAGKGTWLWCSGHPKAVAKTSEDVTAVDRFISYYLETCDVLIGCVCSLSSVLQSTASLANPKLTRPSLTTET